MVDTAARRGHDVRGWGYAGLAGGLGFLAASLVGTISPGADETTGWRLVAAVSTVLLLGCVVGIGRSGAAGTGWAGRTGLVLAGLGWVLVALGFTISAVVGLDAVALYATGTGLLFFGSLLAGIAVVRAGVWSGAWRWAPLTAAVLVLPLAPLFDRDDALGALAGAVWMLGWLWVGAAVVARGRA
jgi:hypothetical protein